jgi:hypothetical protein
VVGKPRLNEWTSREVERRSKVEVVADAPADKPAVGAYRREAS